MPAVLRCSALQTRKDAEIVPVSRIVIEPAETAPLSGPCNVHRSSMGASQLLLTMDWMRTGIGCTLHGCWSNRSTCT